MTRFLTILFILIVSFDIVEAQHFNMSASLGSTYYQGDLAPSTSPFSYSAGKAAWSVGVGYDFNDNIGVKLMFLNGQIAGSDAQSKIEARQIRNLSFATPLWEIGTRVDWNVNQVIPGLNKYGLEFFISLGVNIFHFEPKAVYNGQIVSLRVLGTEGQGMPGYGDFYSPTQINIPFGFGTKFRLTRELDLGFEMIPRFTFTDYLDDVSTEYVSREELLEAGRPQTAILSNRTGEFLGSDSIDYPSGTPRGNPDDNDLYIYGAITLTYNFGEDKPLHPVKKKSDLIPEDK